MTQSLFQIQSANLQPLQRMVEDINDQASDFTACNVVLSTQILSRLEDINTRWVNFYLAFFTQIGPHKLYRLC